jgi:predicted PurR-regulated permease PerM
MPMTSPAERHRRVRVDIQWRTIFKILTAVALVWLWLRLWQWVLLLLISIFLAVGLDPLVTWLDAHRLRRAYGAPLIILLIAGLLIGFSYLAGAELIEQARLLGTRIEDVQRQLTERLPPFLLKLLPDQSQGGGSQVGNYAVRLGQALATGVLSLGAALILTIYFLLDGRRTYEWLVAFAPRRQRPRVRRTAIEGREAVMAYVRGNALTSAIAAVSAYLFCIIAGVPAPLLLGLLTGLFDLVPVIGIFLTLVPMVLLALTVSSWVAIATVAYNAAYNLVENYYISPKVYGNELQLSSLAVILVFASGAELGGVVGALVALPLAAMYPTIESVWLADRLAPEVVADHRRIEQAKES